MSLIALGTVALDHVKTPEGARDDLLGGFYIIPFQCYFYIKYSI